MSKPVKNCHRLKSRGNPSWRALVRLSHSLANSNNQKRRVPVKKGISFPCEEETNEEKGQRVPTRHHQHKKKKSLEKEGKSSEKRDDDLPYPELGRRTIQRSRSPKTEREEGGVE